MQGHWIYAYGSSISNLCSQSTLQFNRLFKILRIVNISKRSKCDSNEMKHSISKPPGINVESNILNFLEDQNK